MTTAKEIIERPNQMCHKTFCRQGPCRDFHESAVSLAYQSAVSQPNIRFADRPKLLLTKVRLGRNQRGFSALNSPCPSGLVNVTNYRRQQYFLSPMPYRKQVSCYHPYGFDSQDSGQFSDCRPCGPAPRHPDTEASRSLRLHSSSPTVDCARAFALRSLEPFD